MSLYKVSMNYGKTGSVYYTLKSARKKQKQMGEFYVIYKLTPSAYSKHLPTSQRFYYYKRV